MGGHNSSLSGMPPDVRDLHVAVMKNDAALVQILVESGIDLNYPWQSADPPSIKDGSTPLCEAVSLNHRNIVQILISAGAFVNKPDNFGSCPLHKAAYHGRTPITEMLLLAGADYKLQDHNMNTPLHICVQNALIHNKIETVRVLIQAGARVNEPNRFGKIPLHYSSLWGLGEITALLIKANSTIDYADYKFKTPLYCSVRAINVLQRKREVFQQHLPAIIVLVMSGCDTLNFATWLRKNQILNQAYHANEELYQWYLSSQPESLKHLCREAIQKSTRFEEDNAYKIKSLPLPSSLKEYVRRKLL